MNKTIVILLVLIILNLTLGLGYFIFLNQKNLNSKTEANAPTTQQPETLASPSPSGLKVSPSPEAITLASTQAKILELSNTTNRATFEKYFAKTVNVTIYASDCCQSMPTVDAIKKLEYINEGMPITFDQNNTTIVNLKAKNEQLAGTYMGLSQTKEQVVAYKINPVTNLIESVFMSVSWKLLNQ